MVATGESRKFTPRRKESAPSCGKVLGAKLRKRFGQPGRTLESIVLFHEMYHWFIDIIGLLKVRVSSGAKRATTTLTAMTDMRTTMAEGDAAPVTRSTRRPRLARPRALRRPTTRTPHSGGGEGFVGTGAAAAPAALADADTEEQQAAPMLASAADSERDRGHGSDPLPLFPSDEGLAWQELQEEVDDALLDNVRVGIVDARRGGDPETDEFSSSGGRRS